MTDKQLDSIRGVFYGQAIGDAWGLGTEFLTKKDIAAYYPNGLSDYAQIVQDNHRSRWRIGDWTDDTDQFLCLCTSILASGGVHELAFAEELYRWFKAVPMGIGQTVYKVVSLPQFTQFPYKASELVWKMSRQKSASNGAIMRTGILGIFDFWDDALVAENTVRMARVTHWDNRCVGSCVVATILIAHLIRGSRPWQVDQLAALADTYDPRIRPYIQLAAQARLEELQLADAASLGYTLRAMAAGLWAYFQAENFETGLWQIIHEGGDADTNAAVAGSILGAKFGFRAIPKRLVDGLVYREELDAKCTAFIRLVEERYRQRQL